MKQNRILCMAVVGFLAAGIAILSCRPESAEAAKKFTERNISIQKGKSYKLDDFLKLAATGKSVPTFTLIYLSARLVQPSATKR